MSLAIKVPPVGESISEVTLSNWVKNDGDHVEMDDVIAELESDKATFELTAEAAGTLRTTAKEGDVLAIGAVVCNIEATDGQPIAPTEIAPTEKAPVKEVSPTIEPAGADAPQVAKAPIAQDLDIRIPAVGESIQEVTLTKWMKKDGDEVEMDEPLAELESDKATFELNAESAGKLSIITQEGEVVIIGTLVGKIAASAGAPQTEKTPIKEVSEHAEIAAGNDQPKTYASGVPSPAAAKILAEKGLDGSSINGNGVGGRITKEDALKAEAPKPAAKTESKPAPAPAPAKSIAPAPQPVVAGSRGERREKMSSLRKTVAKRLVAVKNETAMLTTFNEVDMQPIMELRTKYKDKFKEKHQVGLGFMSFFTKAVTEALKDWPSVGARIEGEEVVYSDFADISIAVSAPKGLVVPIIRNADAMSLAEIEKAIVALAGKARESKLTIEEMTGGTFTITNGGVFGSMLSTPIINAPQSAILGMHNIIERPVAVNGQVVIRPMMYLALSYDHRIVDGRESVSFLVRVKQLLEDPARLLLGV